MSESQSDADKPKSFGNISEHHWSRARAGANQEAMEHLRERSRAPGVAEGGASRNHYCMECHGVLPLAYDQRAPADEAHVERCPHCGAKVDPRVRAMFNWVEIDQPPRSDLHALLPILAIGFLALLGLVMGLYYWFS